MSCGTAVLEIEGLHVTLAGPCHSPRPMVSDVRLTVNRGQVTGLIGESGCGKSLTCLAVMDLLPPALRRSEGAIRLAGEMPDKASRSLPACFRGRRAAMVLQNPMSCFDAIFTVGRHIDETLAAHGLSPAGQRQRVRATLVDLGFERPDEILAAYPFQLSGGMLQRVMVSLALLLEAELLIADEPTTDLDVIVQARILDLIDQLRREKNVGVLLVTHDLSVIARLADQVAVMHGGRIVESGPVSDIFTAAAQPYTRDLLAAHFSLYGRLAGEGRA